MFKIEKQVMPNDRIKCDCCGKLRTTLYAISGEHETVNSAGLFVCRDGLHKLRKLLAVLTSPKRGTRT